MIDRREPRNAGAPVEGTNPEPVNTGDILIKIAESPRIAELNSRLSILAETDYRFRDLGREMETYYWRDGVPYFKGVDEKMVRLASDDLRMSFHWEGEPGGIHERFKKPRPVKNDKDGVHLYSGYVTLDQAEVPGTNLAIATVRYEGQRYGPVPGSISKVITENGLIISPAFDEVTHDGENNFTATNFLTDGSKISAGARVLTNEEVLEVLEKKDEHYDLHTGIDSTLTELKQVKTNIMAGVLKLYGINRTVDNRKGWNGETRFTYAGRYIKLSFQGDHVYFAHGDASLVSNDWELMRGVVNELYFQSHQIGHVIPIALEMLASGEYKSLDRFGFATVDGPDTFHYSSEFLREGRRDFVLDQDGKVRQQENSGSLRRPNS